MTHLKGLCKVLAAAATASVWLILAVSCNGATAEYSEYRNIPAHGWLYGDTLTFTPEFPDSRTTGRLVAAVTHSSDFPYSTVWLEITTRNVRGGVCRDTARLRLADSFGRWRGTGLGAHRQMSDTVSRRTLVSGVPVQVRHIMRTDTLTGISQVGIFFVPD